MFSAGSLLYSLFARKTIFRKPQTNLEIVKMTQSLTNMQVANALGSL